MYLALKRTPPSDANKIKKSAASLTKWRLCSEYSHGGIVIGDYLYHATVHSGFIRQKFNITQASEGWDLWDLGQANDEAFLKFFKENEGVPYDWFGLLVFVVDTGKADIKRLYCFEVCAVALQIDIRGRVTPEMLLKGALSLPGVRRVK